MRITIFLVLISSFFSNVYAGQLIASWYSVESLHKDGQWSITKGVCADGSQFKDEAFTCAMWGYSLGTYVKITSIATKKWVVCRVNDRIGRRFAGKRIDLAPAAFKAIAPLSQGIVLVKVEVMK